MNRDFFLPQITPAKARMLVQAARVGNVFMSPDVAERASLDLLSVDDLDTHLDIDPVGLGICQFIADYQHRCVIPYEFGDQQVYRAIGAMIPKDREVIFITDDPIIWVRTMGEKITPFSEKNTDRLQHVRVWDLKPAEMTRARQRYVVANLTCSNVGYEWLGKLFPQMIIYCKQDDQMSLPLGGTMTGQTTNARHCAAILYPQVVQAIERDRNLKLRGDAALPLLGCYNRLLIEKSKKPFKLDFKKLAHAGGSLDDI